MVRHAQGTVSHQALPKLINHGPQYRPGIAKAKGDFLADEVVFQRQPQPKTKLPVAQAAEQFRDFGKFILTDCRRFLCLILRVIVLIAHHALEGCEQCRGVFNLGRLDKVHAVALMAIGGQIAIDGCDHIDRSCFAAQCAKQKLRWNAQHQIAQLLACSNQLCDFKQVRIGLHGLGFDTG